LFKRNDKKNRKSTPTPKMPFAARFSCLLDYRFQFYIKILSEELMMINFTSKSLEFVQLLICKKTRGLFLFKRNEQKNRRGTLTPKMLFAWASICFQKGLTRRIVMIDAFS